MSTPTWNAPATGDTFSAGQITQFLGTHGCTYIFDGSAQVLGANGTDSYFGSLQSEQTWVDIPWQTSSTQTTVTRVELYFGAQSGSQPLATLSLQTDNGGIPSGTILGTPLTFVSVLSSQIVSFPYPVSGLSINTVYHWVISNIAGTTYYQALQGDGTIHGFASQSGVGTSQPSSWTSLGATLGFTVYAYVGGRLRHTWEDDGARWTTFVRAANGTVNFYVEEVGAATSVRNLVYSDGILISVS